MLRQHIVRPTGQMVVPVRAARTRGHATYFAPMRLPKLKVELDKGLVRRLEATAEQLWPGRKEIGVNRLVRDGLRRYLRYCNEPGNRSKR